MPESSFLRNTLQAFRHRDFRLMWLGVCAPTIGAFVLQFAQSWLVYDLTKNAFYLRLDLFLGQLPIILFSLVGGVFRRPPGPQEDVARVSIYPDDLRVCIGRA